MRKVFHALMVLAALFLLIGLAASCKGGDDDDDNGGAPADDDTAVADDDATDDDADDDLTDDAADDDTADDDTADDDTAPPTTDGFAFIPHGSYVMGSPESEPGRRENETQHDVALTRDLEMSITEIRQEQFHATMGYNPSVFQAFDTAPHKPVEKVSWFDALAYADKLSEAAGYAPCYTLTDIVCDDGTAGDATAWCMGAGGIGAATVALNGAATVYDCEGFRLPTEAEWEYAARAGTTTAFYNGDIVNTACYPVDPNLDAIAWYCGNNNSGFTHYAGVKAPNAWGLRDMAGNVEEWTWDWYGAALPASETDPIGPDSGVLHSVRGGGIRFDGALRCRSAYRTAHSPGYRDRYVGFRLVRTYSAPQDVEPPAARPAPVIANAEPARDYPDSLPFEFTRPDVGTPLTPEEVTAFTKKITGFFKISNYFHWLLWVSHGMTENDPEGTPDFKLFYGDMGANKSAGVVTFTHGGFDDNLTIPTSKFFNNVMALYLMTGDAAAGRLVEQYSKGYAAESMGMMWADESLDPERGLFARAIFPHNHTYVEEGREAFVNYDPVKHESHDWNAHTVENPNNPYWGDIWVRNMRSKDDIPHIYRTVPMLKRVVQDGADESVRAVAAEALAYITAFAKDNVDSGWYTRTKEGVGDAFVPRDDNGFVVDLASYVNYIHVDPQAECSGPLSTALVGYGSPMNVDCGNGIGWVYETIATFPNLGHYYNYEILRYFHVAGVTNALMDNAVDTARAQLEGLAVRVDYMMHTDANRNIVAEWWRDAAAFLLASATAGLPLTSEEARLVMDQYSAAADYYVTWPYWDMWDASVPDGDIPWRPDGPYVATDNISFIFEYCYSPFRNATTAPLLDCNVVAHPELWGE